MSKKEYEAIARILRESSVTKGYDSLCYSMAEFMGRENPRFNRSLFLEACNSSVNYEELRYPLQKWEGRKRR